MAPYSEGDVVTAEDELEAFNLIEGLRHQGVPRVVGLYQRGGEGPVYAMKASDLTLIRAALETNQLDTLVPYMFEGTEEAIQLAAFKLGAGERGGQSFYEIALLYTAMNGNVNVKSLEAYFPGRNVATLRARLQIFQNNLQSLILDFGYEVTDVQKVLSKDNAASFNKWQDAIKKGLKPKSMEKVAKDVMTAVLARAAEAELARSQKKYTELTGEAEVKTTRENVLRLSDQLKAETDRRVAAETASKQRTRQALLAARITKVLTGHGIGLGKHTDESLLEAVDQELAILVANANANANTAADTAAVADADAADADTE